MRRTLVITASLLVLALLYPSVASSTIYIGAGNLGGYIGAWNPDSGRFEDIFLQYSGPMQVSFEQRMVDDPFSPGGTRPEISLSVQTRHRATWEFTGDGVPHLAFAGISSGGFVPQVNEPPGFGPMTLSVGDLGPMPGFIYVGGITQGEHSLDLPGNFYENSYSLFFGFSGVEVPEPASMWILAAVGVAGLGLGRRRGSRGTTTP